MDQNGTNGDIPGTNGYADGNNSSTNGDTEMADCDCGEVVTMMDVLKSQEEEEEDANAVLGGSDEKQCTYSQGYIKRQAIYACMTCCPDSKKDESKRAGVCLACSLICHENHELIELYTKRNFRCDCGNPNFNMSCKFTGNKPDLNVYNSYNQNFVGLYCICSKPYGDRGCVHEDDAMIQCAVCEDWWHVMHLEAVVPPLTKFNEMICKLCLEKYEFLHSYSYLAVSADDADADAVNVKDETESDDTPSNDVAQSIVNGTVEVSADSEQVPANNIETSCSETTENLPISDNEASSSEKDTTSSSVVASTQPDASDVNDQEISSTNTVIEASADKTEGEPTEDTSENLKDIPVETSPNKSGDTSEVAAEEKTIEIEKQPQLITKSTSEISETEPPKTVDGQADTESSNTEVQETEEPKDIENKEEEKTESEKLRADTIIKVENEPPVQNTNSIKTTESIENENKFENESADITKDISEVMQKDTINDETIDANKEAVSAEKRKIPSEYETEDNLVKKPKLDEKCIRPKNSKYKLKGATFWPAHFREKLCTCNVCIPMYQDLGVLFLTDEGDTVAAYEDLGREKMVGMKNQYEKGMEALGSLGRIQQIDALTEYNKMRDKLLTFLRSIKERNAVVTEHDIKNFFAGMKPEKRNDGVYFCG